MKTSKTQAIESILMEAYKLHYGCHEVTIGFGTAVNGRVDYMVMDSKGIIKCFEIKVSKSDFRSGNINSFEGDLNYYVLPHELFAEIKGEVPDFVGVYVCDEQYRYLTSVKKAKRQKITPERRLELTQYLARSLSREAALYQELKNGHTVPTLKKKIKQLTKERDAKEEQCNEAWRELNDIMRDIEELFGQNFLDDLPEKAKIRRDERRRKIQEMKFGSLGNREMKG